MTGHPLLQPFSLYDPTDRPAFPASPAELGRILRINVAERSVDLLAALPLSLLFVFLFCYRSELRGEVAARPLVLVFAGLFAAYLFYPYSGFNLYGPRYLYESMGALLILSSLVMARTGTWGGILLSTVLLFNLGHFVQSTRRLGAFVREAREVYAVTERAGLRDAIVFLRMSSGYLPPRDLARNGIHFDGPVLYVLDRGPLNREMLRRFPGRRAYVWEYDLRRREGRVTPYPAEREGGS